MTAASTTPALEVTDLQVAFSHPRPAVRSIGLRVNRGEIVVLVGESGSGKSITARAAMGLLPHAAIATGSVKVDGVEVLGASEREREGHPRRAGRDGLPGAADGAQSCAHGRLADR